MERKRLELLRRRSEALHLVSLFFRRLGYLEVDTPLLAPFLIPESSLEVFRTLATTAGGEPREMYLIPSPELWMKRLLAEGCGSLFQICHAFRNHEPASPLHQPEFTLLEWYTVGAVYLDSIAVLEGLFSFLLKRMALKPLLPFRGKLIDLSPPFPRLSMDEAFRSALDIRLEELGTLPALEAAATRLGVTAGPGDSWADLFHKLFLTYVEPALPAGRPLVLYDYPAALPTLAKRKAGSPWAERWELYLAGVELANCYSESTEASAIEAFFSGQELAKRRAREPHRIDWPLARQLQESLPACSGVALGMDRLLMVLLDRESVGEVNAFASS